MGIIKLKGCPPYNYNPMVPWKLDRLLKNYSGNMGYWEFITKKKSPLVLLHRRIFNIKYNKNNYIKRVVDWYSGKNTKINHPFISYPNGKIKGRYIYKYLRNSLTYYDYIIYTGIPEQRLQIPSTVHNAYDSFTLYALEKFFYRINAYESMKLVTKHRNYYPRYLYDLNLQSPEQLIPLLFFFTHTGDSINLLWTHFLIKILYKNSNSGLPISPNLSLSIAQLLQYSYDWIKGNLGFPSLYQKVFDLGLFGVFDDVFLWEKVANRKAFVSFGDKLKVVVGEYDGQADLYTYMIYLLMVFGRFLDKKTLLALKTNEFLKDVYKEIVKAYNDGLELAREQPYFSYLYDRIRFDEKIENIPPHLLRKDTMVMLFLHNNLSDRSPHLFYSLPSNTMVYHLRAFTYPLLGAGGSSIRLRRLNLRDTYLQTKNALIGLAYALLFCLKKNYNNEVIIIETKLEEFLKNCLKLEGNKLYETMSRIRKVIKTGEIAKGIPIDLSFCDYQFCEKLKIKISNSNDFDACARYEYVLEREEDSCWKQEFINAAQELKECYRNVIKTSC